MIRAGLAAVVLAGLSAAAAASDYGYGTHAPVPVPTYRAVTPGCTDYGPLDRIRERFLTAQNRAYRTGLEIAAFGYVEEVRLEPRGRSLVERRFCQGFVELTNGERPRLYYVIESNQGFAGVGSRVEFCVEGHDHWRVHDGFCRTVRPPR